MTALSRVQIVPMERFHLREVVRVDQLVYPHPWSIQFFRDELEKRDTRHYVVAQIDGQHVGHAGVMVLPDAGHVSTVVVSPAFQRRGIGAQLMLDLHRWAVARALPALTLEVRVSNAAAIALYRRFGYAPAGVRKNYYREEGEDALVMWVEDIVMPEHQARLAEIENEMGER